MNLFKPRPAHSPVPVGIELCEAEVRLVAGGDPLSEMMSMRLQMAMDRRSKFVETLSNVLKTIDSTSSAIVQNMK